MILISLSVLMMSLDHRNQVLESIRGGIALLVYPVQAVVNMPFAAGNWLGENMVSRETLLDENKTLHTQQLVLKAQLQKMISLELENMRLRKLLESSYELGEKVLVAELVAVDLDPFARQTVINKGTRNKVYVGQPVLDSEGVFGQIVHASALTATAMLVTDPSHSVPVQVNRNGLRAIAAGTGADDKLELLHIPNNADIRIGDMLTTSGLGGIFPRGYPVARVFSVEPDSSQPYASVSAIPLAKLNHSREVILLWPDNGPPIGIEPVPEKKADATDDAGDTSTEKPVENAAKKTEVSP